MAGQTTPHTQNHSDVSTDLELDVARNPKDYDTGNDKDLAGDTDGAQTAGDRSFHQNQGSGLPKAVAEGTADIGARDITLPTQGGQGASNAPAATERKEQEKVLGK